MNWKFWKKRTDNPEPTFYPFNELLSRERRIEMHLQKERDLRLLVDFFDFLDQKRGREYKVNWTKEGF